MGEISFCAYNTGVGWRQIVEKMHMNATTAQWFKTKGRHKIYAGGKSVPLAEPAKSIRIPLLDLQQAESSAAKPCASCAGH
jgi:hypothetical protein